MKKNNMNDPLVLEVIAEKAAKWDALYKKLLDCYVDEEGNEIEDDTIDLGTIGEIALSAFGL